MQQPTVYDHRNVYDNGGGGGVIGIKIFSDFSEYDLNTRIDTPLIGNSYGPFDTNYTVTKENWGIKLKAPGNNNTSPLSPYAFGLDYEKMELNFALSSPTSAYNFIWFDDYAIGTDVSGNILIWLYNYLNANTTLTLDNDDGTLSRYFTGFKISNNKGLIFEEILTNDGFINLYLNGEFLAKFLKTKMANPYQYVNFSPRYSGEILLFSFLVR